MPLIINEWMPNPVGSDTAGEWVELLNSGAEPVRTSGSYLTTGASATAPTSGTVKKYFLPDRTLAAGEYLLLPRSLVKITLKNTDGALSLYDSAGTLLDSVKFVGSAPEEKSFSRVPDASDLGGSGQFLFSDPTPGAVNVAPQNLATAAIVSEQYQLGTPLHPSQPLFMGALLALAIGALLAFAVTAMMGEHAEIPYALFGRN